MKTYIAIDLKSFYASVECADRGLDALTTNLVVADASRTSKTICLAVSPSLKAYGIGGRARLFQVEQKVKEANSSRLMKAAALKAAELKKDEKGRLQPFFKGRSCNSEELAKDPSLGIDFLIAPPQMKRYMEISTKIYQIYLKYIAPEDIHVYSIDEVFIDAGGYLDIYQKTGEELARMLIENVLQETGITATAGIGTNLYLCKIAMDIVAKHMPPDKYGVRIAVLDELEYRKLLWTHEPLTDFWRVGQGISKKLARYDILTMGDIARCSIGKAEDFYNEDLLYRLLGVNAELLIDHAWGYEPCTIKEIKAYKPESSSIQSGQVLHCPYTAEKTRLVVKEMADLQVLQLKEKKLLTDQITLTIGYDVENLQDPVRAERYKGPVVSDFYGRLVPKHARKTIHLSQYTASTKRITEAVLEGFDSVIDPALLVRRIYLNADHLQTEEEYGKKTPVYEQLELFVDYEQVQKDREKEKEEEEKEEKLQKTMLTIKQKYGKNAILKGMNLEEGATAIQRNTQVGGHKG